MVDEEMVVVVEEEVEVEVEEGGEGKKRLELSVTGFDQLAVQSTAKEGRG